MSIEDNNAIMYYRNELQSDKLQRLIKKDIKFVSAYCHGLAKECGWWGDIETGKPVERNQGELIALMHSELSEALEALRKDLMDDHLPHRKGIEVELADTVIRIMDFCGAFNLDLGGAIAEKLAYNANRSDHKPENRAKDDGKRF